MINLLGKIDTFGEVVHCSLKIQNDRFQTLKSINTYSKFSINFNNYVINYLKYILIKQFPLFSSIDLSISFQLFDCRKVVLRIILYEKY